MKKLSMVMIGIFLAGFSYTTMAAESTVLTVQGSLGAGSCTPEIADGGVVNVNKVNVNNLSTTQDSSLGSFPVALTISCDGPTKVGFSVTDDQDGTEHRHSNDVSVNDFGLGDLPDGTTGIGYYQIMPDLVNVDGSPYSIYASTDGGVSWTHPEVITPDNSIYAAAQSSTSDTTLAGSFFAYSLTLHPFIDNTDNRLGSALTDDADFQGSATFGIVYL
jgi:hypothetical protein